MGGTGLSDAAQRIDVRRLIVEGVVIVVSILLAFALDALWEGHLERRRLATTMQQLRQQLVTNRELANSRELNSRTIDQLERFLVATPEDFRTMPQDSAVSVASGLVASYNAYDQRGGVAASVPVSGLLTLVDDAVTRDDLDVASLATPAGYDEVFGTSRRCLQYVADHWYMHRGHLADARRAASRERMWL